jgi:hypothetical protein
MVKAGDKQLDHVQAMKAWVIEGIAPLFINLSPHLCSALVEVNSQIHTPADLSIEGPYLVPSSRLHPVLGYAAVNIGYHYHKK